MKGIRFSAILLSALLVSAMIIGAQLPARAQDGDTLKIGALLPLSGGAATWGIPSLRSLELMTEKINSGGGVNVGGKRYRMELIKADTKSNFDAALAQANKLIFEDKVKFINGPIISGEVLAILPVTEANKVIVMSYAASPKVIGSDKPYAFRLYPSVRESTVGFFEYLSKNRKEIKTMGLIGPNDESGWDNSKLIREIAKNYAIEISFEDFVSRGTSDFFPVLTKLAAKNPQSVMFHATPGGMTALLLQQSYQLGYKGLVLVPSHQDPSLLVEKAGADAAEGCILTTPDFATGTEGMRDAYRDTRRSTRRSSIPSSTSGTPCSGCSSWPSRGQGVWIRRPSPKPWRISRERLRTDHSAWEDSKPTARSVRSFIPCSSPRSREAR